MPSFPASPYLSVFARPPDAATSGPIWYENPLSEGGKWALTRLAGYPLQKTGIVSAPVGTPGNATDSVHADTVSYSHWTPETFDSEHGVEVWACTAGGQLGAALETWRVALWYTLGQNVDGYLLYYGGGIGKGFGLRRYDAGNFFGIGSAGGGYPERMGLRINGETNLLEIWAMYGGVWSMQGSPVDDPTYRGRFWLGLGIEDPTGGGLAFPCFGGGVPRRTQFFRWTRGYKEEVLGP